MPASRTSEYGADTSDRDVTRVAVLFSRLSGYMASCLRTLADRHHVELLVIRYAPAEEAPFDSGYFDWIHQLHDRSRVSRSDIVAHLENFGPDAVLMAGWFDNDYLHAARQMRKQGIPVVAGSDAQWRGTFRQRLGQATAGWHLHPAIDVLWVAGERQRQFAYRLGYVGNRCWSGYYACDWNRFGSVYDRRATAGPELDSNPYFLFTGRYVPVKGLDVLAAAYEEYRTMVEHPWNLVCAGAGPESSWITGVDGIRDVGFVQPEQLSELMAQAGALVLSSRREPWGVVIQEAAATGLPLILSHVCGASVHLLQDGYNGYQFQSENVQHLSQCLKRLSEAPAADREIMGHRSHELSKQYTPERWADTFITGVNQVATR